MTFWLESAAEPEPNTRCTNSTPLPLSSRKIARNRCPVLTEGLPCSRAHSMASSSTCFDSVVKGVSKAFPPEPRPINSSSLVRISGNLKPSCSNARKPTSVASAKMPTSNISVPTKSWAKRLDSPCASITALMVFSVNRSNIIAPLVVHDRALATGPGREKPTFPALPPIDTKPPELFACFPRGAVCFARRARRVEVEVAAATAAATRPVHAAEAPGVGAAIALEGLGCCGCTSPLSEATGWAAARSARALGCECTPALGTSRKARPGGAARAVPSVGAAKISAVFIAPAAPPR
mmetsp:Transcript_80334/g.203155  ORF Transcript_80334/g.203155 Transcript_80334/m.203155 type:complete len:294 (+) Transcript_80334:2560-3441(+)